VVVSVGAKAQGKTLSRCASGISTIRVFEGNIRAV
jgi:hypothetical protein